MAGRSIFSNDNPNGRIGSQYRATIATNLNSQTIAALQNLATFSNLPVGVYSIAGVFPITTTIQPGGTTIRIDEWGIGNCPSSTSVTAFPFTTLEYIPFSTTISNGGANPVVTGTSVSINFIISVTTAGQSVFINSNLQSGVAVPITWASNFSTTATIVATKLA